MTAHLRIGELARRTGVNPALLRAWERRYGLLEPERTPGGFRLYTDDDVRRIRAMGEHLARGLSAAEAARLARDGAGPAPGEAPALLDALLAFDETGAHARLDRAFAELGRETVLAEILAVLRRIGEGWERGEVTVAQEHFATTVLRGRLLGLARGWDRGTGPRALLVAPPGELHDLGLIVFGLALREHGWRITLLGADTPIATLEEVARRLSPSVVVVAALAPDRLEPVTGELARLGDVAPVVLAGAGASRALAVAAGSGLLPADPFEAAAEVASAGTA